MKYNTKNEPIVCFQTQSTCYRGTKPMDKVLGILWHSTGANNPNLSRYIQPSDNAGNRAQMLELIGKNKYGNDLNHKERSMGMNAWIGKLADGTVATVQTMPWNWRPWGCGAGSRGSCNDSWIQFEICEDSLLDPTYAQQVYTEACELTAYLCKLYGIDPFGTVNFKGISVPTIICHADSHTLGLGNNHGDIYHWFPKIIQKSMPQIREDVANLLKEGGNSAEVTYVTLAKGSKGDAVIRLQKALLARGYDLGKWGADGDFGSATVAAVEKFQTDNGLAATGVANNATLTLLYEEQKLYTATIQHLTAKQIEELKKTYDVAVNEE